MRICDSCGKSMKRETRTGKIMFICVCGETVEGTNKDIQISTGVIGGGETREMYRLLLRNAAHDPVNQLVKRDCKECGRDYMTQVRIGAQEVVVYLCKCGNIPEETILDATKSSS